ncbi:MULTISPECIES: pantoate--beta-alanine ligase [unclassified Candidatus Frackibacter]|uniref:pantoate--beta-alanine ligase n=1 Tax=unclassified Candidatus Frackibacter TaxID=2648818 RepID=UPI000888C56B|nr:MULTISPECIES: pantoate--beta-alanine ligase [unclassified Candidatus Frackibacter]SDC84828.1 pantoate--beta-alanine ligase [Candidatus Frackibacter sp. WG11]SEM99262.1 pantoate--beta-alanine ligase [Candidatus Frackibacter sp. WG12]SFM07256.1 pantoate--beta-alanine ligase [Candidatus Frackibacter sp. WG13]
MKIIKEIYKIREFIKEERAKGKEIGFVPTMGYLHKGHLALMETAKEENDIVVTSIFVNPTQFGPDEDYDEYPRDLKRDTELAAEVGVDLIFAPQPEEIYLSGAATTVSVEGLTDHLCGAHRPGHFDGVCTIVTKLFNIVNPNRAYFGQKDAQQVLVVKRMVKDLNFDIEIVTVPIIREDDGLAISSRNKYLDKEEREAALVLFKALELADDLINAGLRDANVIKEKLVEKIEAEPLAEIDYVGIVGQERLETLNRIEGKVLIALAVYIGETRLIDNLMLEVSD